MTQHAGNGAGGALAEALRAWRRRMTPEAAGLVPGDGRQVEGLRREELSLLAGVSVDYLVRLEQGRARNPSPQVVEALANALQLTGDERQELYRLAGSAPPGTDSMPRRVPAAVHQLTQRLADSPAAVFSLGWDILEWNALWSVLTGDPATWHGLDRNLLWRHFAGPGHGLCQDGEDLATYERELVADLRLAVGRFPGDPGLRRLVDALCAASSTFATLWNRFDLSPRTAGRKTFAPALFGELTLDCTIMTITGHDIKLLVFTAVPGSSDETKLAALRAVTVDGVDGVDGSGSAPLSVTGPADRAAAGRASS